MLFVRNVTLRNITQPISDFSVYMIVGNIIALGRYYSARNIMTQRCDNSMLFLKGLPMQKGTMFGNVICGRFNNFRRQQLLLNSCN